MFSYIFYSYVKSMFAVIEWQSNLYSLKRILEKVLIKCMISEFDNQK